MKLIRLIDNLIHVCTYSILLVILSSTSQQELCQFPFWQRSQVCNKTRTQLKFINLINTHSKNIKRLSITALPCFKKKSPTNKINILVPFLGCWQFCTVSLSGSFLGTRPYFITPEISRKF